MDAIKREQIAKTIYSANRAYSQTLGDESFPEPWETAPDWQQQTILNGIDFHLENPNATPEQSHESWLREKTENGWVYGPVKDAEKKTHPCIRTYETLPEAQRKKDSLFIGIFNALK